MGWVENPNPTDGMSGIFKALWYGGFRILGVTGSLLTRCVQFITYMIGCYVEFCPCNLAIRLVSPEVGPRHCRSQGEIGSKPTRALGFFKTAGSNFPAGKGQQKRRATTHTGKVQHVFVDTIFLFKQNVRL